MLLILVDPEAALGKTETRFLEWERIYGRAKELAKGCWNSFECYNRESLDDAQ